MSIALTYRPTDFDMLVGQHFVKHTLKQAIIHNKLVGVYLFYGPKGTGKTSTARIFAKAINCMQPIEGNPCYMCATCTKGMKEGWIDIIEIDAASYTGVDNIREIIEKAQFPPLIGKYKVYIIDEVHMLSKGAFNACLKLFEEPPSHVKFILATTEIEKIPETILSRCQTYEFLPLSIEDIEKHLLFVAQKEGVYIDKESVAYIAHESNGGLRDALMLFEQLIEGKSITIDSIEKKLGIPQKTLLDTFLKKIIQQDPSALNECMFIGEHYHIPTFWRRMLHFIKEKTIKALEAHDSSLETLIYILKIFDAKYDTMKKSVDPLLTLLATTWEALHRNKESILSPPIEEYKAHTHLHTKTDREKKDITEEAPDNTPSLEIEDIHALFSKTHNITEGKREFKESLIEIFKKNNVKAVIVRALKQADIIADNGELSIVVSHNFHKKYFETMEIHSILSGFLQEHHLRTYHIVHEKKEKH